MELCWGTLSGKQRHRYPMSKHQIQHEWVLGVDKELADAGPNTRAEPVFRHTKKKGKLRGNGENPFSSYMQFT